MSEIFISEFDFYFWCKCINSVPCVIAMNNLDRIALMYEQLPIPKGHTLILSLGGLLLAFKRPTEHTKLVQH